MFARSFLCSLSFGSRHLNYSARAGPRKLVLPKAGSPDLQRAGGITDIQRFHTIGVFRWSVGLIFTDVTGNGPLWRSNLHGYGLSMRWTCIASRRRHLGADAHAHAPERNSILDVIAPANSTGLCHCRKQGRRRFLGSSRQASRLLVVSMWGVGPKSTIRLEEIISDWKGVIKSRRSRCGFHASKMTNAANGPRNLSSCRIVADRNECATCTSHSSATGSIDNSPGGIFLH
jgi:hypothetical protein